MLKRFLLTLAACMMCMLAGAQIVNRLRVDQDTFLRYAYGRMQQFNPANLELADSLYSMGERRDDYRYKCLALSLEMPVRYAQGEYDRLPDIAEEVKLLLDGRKNNRDFYFSFIHEYCEYLVHIDRMSEAMLEARDMERLASLERRPLGRMYAYHIIALIQSERDNAYLAVLNLEKAVRFCREARAEQDLPALFLLLAQENLNMKKYSEAESYISKAEEYSRFFPSVPLKAMMTRACLYYAENDLDAFWETYEAIMQNPLYSLQADADSRFGLDICNLRSRGMLDEALSKADSLGTMRARLEQKHGIYAEQGAYDKAYGQLSMLMNEMDSVYIKVQNEDLAILDAEMNNAQLREEAQRLKAQNQMTILIGFLVMFAIAFFAILLSQWQLRENLDEMLRKNNQMLASRREFQRAMESKESEIENRIKILQNRKTNMLRL